MVQIEFLMYAQYHVTSEMIAMVVYDWMKQLDDESKKSDSKKLNDLRKADPNKILVYSPQPLLYGRFGRNDDDGKFIDELIREDFDFYVPNYQSNNFPDI